MLITRNWKRSLSSFYGILGLANVILYCASKFAVRGPMYALSEEIRCCWSVGHQKSQIRLTTIYPIMGNIGLLKILETVRFPFLLDLLPPGKVAYIIVREICRKYKEISIPRGLITMDHLSRFIPEKFDHYVRYLLDTGLDPDN